MLRDFLMERDVNGTKRDTLCVRLDQLIAPSNGFKIRMLLFFNWILSLLNWFKRSDSDNYLVGCEWRAMAENGVRALSFEAWGETIRTFETRNLRHPRQPASSNFDVRKRFDLKCYLKFSSSCPPSYSAPVRLEQDPVREPSPRGSSLRTQREESLHPIIRSLKLPFSKLPINYFYHSLTILLQDNCNSDASIGLLEDFSVRSSASSVPRKGALKMPEPQTSSKRLLPLEEHQKASKSRQSSVGVLLN